MPSLRSGADGATRAGYTGRLPAPDGRHEHLPLRPVAIEAADVTALSATATTTNTTGASGLEIRARRCYL
ncbi:hypothetical protein Psi01_34990 [Planobispora siamensis]|uniref:Uncharacterized protein n=1 Tax=Planobispora siamensis TaxID=936338 RepID=A0A8J3WJE6_9ACTN|nr:hypothetical protein Psi01_34990 [Planobispora siamensis]